MKRKHQDGDVVGCNLETDEYFVRGHLPLAEAIESIACWSCEIGAQYELVAHTHIRFVPSDDVMSGEMSIYRTKPGRGAFKVTVCREIV